LRVAYAAALHIDSDSDAGAYANTYSMRVYAELSDANTYSMRVYAELSDANTYSMRVYGELSDAYAYPDSVADTLSGRGELHPNSYPLRRSSVCDPNPYSLHRCGLRDADTHTVSGRRELPNADGDPDSYPDAD
jgi:hypothetical protein